MSENHVRLLCYKKNSNEECGERECWWIAMNDVGGDIVVSERALECGTSKTCGNCFELNEELTLNKNDWRVNNRYSEINVTRATNATRVRPEDYSTDVF